MENIKLSVIIPVYNCKTYLKRCVDSVLKQKYENFEIILADDGSTDGSAELCDSFEDERIKAFHKQNEGPLMTRVFGVSKATGDYSLFIDCDDYVDEGYFERLAGIIEKENCDLIVCSFRHHGAGGTTEAGTPWKIEKVFSGDEINEFLKVFILSTFLNSMCTKTIRTELLKNDKTDFSRFASFRHGEDLLQSLYPVFNAEKIVYIPECWYNYTENDTSITHTVKYDIYSCTLTVLKETYAYLKNAPFFDDKTHSEHAALAVKSLMGSVKYVAKSDLPQKEKIRIFDEIHSNDFYCNEVADFCDESLLDKKTKMVYKLFVMKGYRTLISLICHLSR